MIGETIRKLRKERKWTQAQLAEKAWVYKADISKIETGYRLPSRKTVEKIANALEVDISTLYYDTSRAELEEIIKTATMYAMDLWLKGAAR